MKISESLSYVGVNDHQIDLFESQYKVPKGMAYNSYLIHDEKTVVIDSVEASFGTEWIEHIRAALDGRDPDYLIVHHMEPDHSGSICLFMETFPQAKVIASAKAIVMMKQFFGTDFPGRTIPVGDGCIFSLGHHELHFVTAPMVHWPEVIMSYDASDHVLFSADAFGKFGALDVDEPWDDEARRYYIGIVGKYGPQVQALFKKVSGLEIRMICSTHGPVLQEDLPHYLGLYQKWAGYEAEKDAILIAFTSVYGHTREAVLRLADRLREKGETVVVRDLAREDMSQALAEAFTFSKVVLATTTYNAGIFPFMHDFIDRLVEHNFQNKTVALIENGSWAPTAGKTMMGMLSCCKNLSFTQSSVHIRSALDEQSEKELEALAEELCEH